MLQKIRQIRKRVAVLMAASTLAIGAGGIGMVHAQNGDEQASGRHEPTPVWEQVDRQIAVNPARPTPPEVQADLVSLKVTYRNFDKQTKYGIVEVHRELKEDTISFFKYAYYLNFPLHEVTVSSDPRFGWDDVKLMEANVTSCFNYRTTSSGTPSQHGLGRACDINPRQNPYITLDDQGNPFVQPKGAYWNVGTPGTLHRDHALMQLMKSRGWAWGGDWTLQDLDGAVIDYQHIQKRAATPAAQETAKPQNP
jgi:hypothetical protein